MHVKLFPILHDVDGKVVMLAHPWPMSLDECFSSMYEEIAFSWVVIFFGKILVITPITLN